MSRTVAFRFVCIEFETRARKHHFLKQNLQVHPKRFSIQYLTCVGVELRPWDSWHPVKGLGPSLSVVPWHYYFDINRWLTYVLGVNLFPMAHQVCTWAALGALPKVPTNLLSDCISYRRVQWEKCILKGLWHFIERGKKNLTEETDKAYARDSQGWHFRKKSNLSEHSEAGIQQVSLVWLEYRLCKSTR